MTARFATEPAGETSCCGGDQVDVVGDARLVDLVGESVDADGERVRPIGSVDRSLNLRYLGGNRTASRAQHEMLGRERRDYFVALAASVARGRSLGELAIEFLESAL